MDTLTILTTTFNRENEILNLYASLKKQNNKEFTWLIIDDGSTDNTEQTIKNLKEHDFEIKYFKKKNGGKHTAFNYALNHLETDLVMIVDSDDVLTTNAVSKVCREWSNSKNPHICGMCFLMADTKGEISGKKFDKERFIGNFNEEYINKADNGEKIIVWASDIIRKYPFPEFENEKYVAETSVWSEVSKKYDMLFINEVIYIYKYQGDGLTFSGRNLRIKNPLGGMYNCKIFFSSEFKWSVKFKKMILYIVYGLFSKLTLREVYNESKIKWLFILLFPVGLALYCVWKMKYTH